MVCINAHGMLQRNQEENKRIKSGKTISSLLSNSAKVIKMAFRRKWDGESHEKKKTYSFEFDIASTNGY